MSLSGLNVPSPNPFKSLAGVGVVFKLITYMEDGKPHIGIRNVRERIQNMVGGSLSITSTEKGTVAVVTIPVKETSK